MDFEKIYNYLRSLSAVLCGTGLYFAVFEIVEVTPLSVIGAACAAMFGFKLMLR